MVSGRGVGLGRHARRFNELDQWKREGPGKRRTLETLSVKGLGRSKKKGQKQDPKSGDGEGTKSNMGAEVGGAGETVQNGTSAKQKGNEPERQGRERG